MKLRNIFTMLAAALGFTFVGCEQQEQFLDEVKVSKSYISLPVGGGEAKIEVDAVADWSIVAWDASAKKETEIPAWLTVEPASGSKGKTEVVFSAEETTVSNEVILHLNCGVACQMLNVVQIAEQKDPEIQTCKWINENGEDGVVYRAKGVVTIVNPTYATYGGFSINDGTATLVVYGSDTKGTYPDLAVGDEVVVDGPWSTKYVNFGNGSQIVSLTKSLIKVEKVSPTTALSSEGDVFTVTLTNKAEKISITIPEADEAWITAGEPLVLGTTVVVEITVAPNESTPRESSITFSTQSGGKTYSATVDIEQEGAIPQLSVADAIKLPADSYFSVAGIVSGVHKKGFVVTDAAGDAIYAYVNKTEEELGAALGDEVIVTGQIGDYANFYQIVNPVVEVVSTGNKPKYPIPVALETAASFETYKTGKFSSVYVEAKGVTTGQYGDIKIGEWTVSPYQTSASVNIADFKDKEVVVRGYLLQYKSDNILRVMLTSVEIDNIIYEEPFAAGMGQYTINNVSLGTLTKEVWSHDSAYRYMKGSGYGGGDGVESWLVSPMYDLTGQTTVFLSFDHILNYLKGASREDHVNVLVKEEGASDWTALSGITWPEGTNWTSVNSGKVDLSSYAGKKIQIAFKYTTTGGNATTWEVYNVKLTID